MVIRRPFFLLLLFIQFQPVFCQNTVKQLVEDGITKARLGDFKEALTSFDKAVAIDSTTSEPYYNRGLVYSQLNDWPAAIRDFSKVILLRPSYPDPYFNRALAKDS